MLALAGIGVLVLGFALRLNPLLVVVLAALATGVGAGMPPLGVLRAFGHAFNANRPITAVYLVLPVIGLLEAHGLQQRAREGVARLRGLTLARLLIAYLALRQLTAAIGLVSIAGPAQTVRPLLAPMAEAAAGEREDPEKVRALAAATDNIGMFFGEDVFIAIGSVLLMRGTLAGMGVEVAPTRLSLWAIPTALATFAIHAARLLWRERR